jgi:hypothetical protein
MNENNFIKRFSFIKLKMNYSKQVFDPFDIPSPVECYKLTLIGSFLSLTFIASVLTNGLLLCVFYSYKKFQTPINHYIIAITVLHFIGSFLEFPMVIMSHYRCR